MFFLHLLDGSRVHRGSVIAVTENETAPIIQHNICGSNLIDENGTPETFDNGWMLGPVPTKNNAKKLAYAIAREYNYDVMVDGEVIGLPYAPAAELGRMGGQSTSTAKQQASRANGRKGGRPRKQNPSS